MCGIAGILNLNRDNVSKQDIKRMTDSLSHRGPDNEGIWINNYIGLGHRRLSIIDTSKNGNQPMVSSNGRWVISYNGEIYNFKEIRANLEKKGINFKSNSDTEVVLNAIIYLGIECIKDFNGMFAFALWDNLEKKMIIGRDRYGIKPLYYYLKNDTFIFGSEQKAITACYGVKKKLNLETIYEYFNFQNIFTENTFLNDIFLLKPGHFLSIDLNLMKPKLIQYWDFNFYESEPKLSEKEYKEELNFLFNESLQRHLVSDVELGTYLSGGLDSGSITSITSKKIKNLKTFTCGFDLSSLSGLEIGFDERSQAEAMSNLFKTEHYQIVLKAGDMENCLPDLVKHLEEPRVGQSYPNYYASKLASNFVKVVLSGTGGDELFGGYPWRYFKQQDNLTFENFVENYFYYWQRLSDDNTLKKLFSPIQNEIKDVSAKDIFKKVLKKPQKNILSKEDLVNQSLYFEAKTFLSGLLLVEDKLSMAHSLENRVPFLDNELVNFAMRCPVKLKIKNLNETFRINENLINNKQKLYFNKTNDGKKILREVMMSYIPKNVSEANKQGFSGPDASWFKGESIDYVKSKLYNKNANIYNFMDHKVVQNEINKHLQGKKNLRLLIWSLLYFEEYLLQL